MSRQVTVGNALVILLCILFIPLFCAGYLVSAAWICFYSGYLKAEDQFMKFGGKP